MDADVAWDVGAVYDAAADRFDHHQRGAPVREDGLPYSAAGLVWRHHGEAAVRALLEPSGAADLAAAVASEIDREVVRRIDEIDNGVGPPGDALGMASLVEDCNPLLGLARHRRSSRGGRGVPARGRPGGGLPAAPRRGRAGAPRRRGRGARRARPLGRPARARTRPQAALGGAGVRACPARCSTPSTRFRTATGWWTRCRRSRAPSPSASRFRRRGPGCATRTSRRPAACRTRCSCTRAASSAAARSREGAMAMARRAIEIGLGSGAAPRR